MNRSFGVLVASAVLGLAALAGPAAAVSPPDHGTLTVNLPCDCVLFNNEAGFPHGITGGLPIGNAPYTPAAQNPSGTAIFTP